MPQTDTDSTIAAPSIAGAVVLAQTTERVVIEARTLRGIWLLLAILTVLLLWALYELRRRRKLALRLDRLSNVSGSPRYPTPSARSPRDYEALLEIIAHDERLPAIAQRVEALRAEDVAGGPAEGESHPDGA